MTKDELLNHLVTNYHVICHLGLDTVDKIIAKANKNGQVQILDPYDCQELECKWARELYAGN